MKHTFTLLTALLLMPLTAPHAADSNPSATPHDDAAGQVSHARVMPEKGYSLSKKPPLRVADFGALGDGFHDDGPAVRKAVEAAIAAGPGSTVLFEKKKYRLGHCDQSAQIMLNGVSGLTIDGSGAEIINNPHNGFISIVGCSNVTMRGFFFDCDPLGFTQGDIVKAEPSKGEIWVQIHDGFANPLQLSEQQKTKVWDNVGFTIDAHERKLKAGPIDFIEAINEVDDNKKLLHIKLQADTFSHIVAGDRFVIGLRQGGGSTIEVRQSADILLADYTIYSSKFGMNHAFSDNHGRVHVKRGNITFRPGTDRLITSIKDGFHCKHNAIGPIIEDCLLEGMMDDAINISVCPYWVKEDLGDNRYLIAEMEFSPRVGDLLMAYTPVPGVVTPKLKVLSVEPQKRGQGKWNIITLDQAIPGLALHQGGDLFPGGGDKLAFTGLYNLDACGKDYIIRNNHFGPQRRHALLARGSGGLIEGNLVDGVGGSGVNLGNEIGSFYEGPFPSDTMIRNNTFRNTEGVPVHVYAHGKGATAKGITIENNRFSDWPESAMQLSNLDGGIIRGNVITTGIGAPSGCMPVVVKHSDKLRIEDNTVHDERSQLKAAFDLSEDVDAASLLMSGNQVKLGPDFPRLMQIIPPPSVQARGQETRPLRAAEDTGAYLKASHGETPSRKDGPIWTLHPLWKNGLKGAVLFELPADLTEATGIRFATHSATGQGDGVVLTVEWKPVSKPDSEYRTCYEGTILKKEWTAAHAKIETENNHVLLRFRFDCGPADNTGYDSVQIANLDIFTTEDGGGAGRGIKC